MQQIIVFAITGLALFYLAYRFLGAKKSKQCDKCDYSKPKQQ